MKGIRFYLVVLAVSGLGIAVNTAFAVGTHGDLSAVAAID